MEIISEAGMWLMVLAVHPVTWVLGLMVWQEMTEE